MTITFWGEYSTVEVKINVGEQQHGFEPYLGPKLSFSNISLNSISPKSFTTFGERKGMPIGVDAPARFLQADGKILAPRRR